MFNCLAGPNKTVTKNEKQVYIIKNFKTFEKTL